MSCSHLELCLNNGPLVASNLIRKAGASDLDWLDELVANGRLTVPPELAPCRAQFVLGRIGDILTWEKTKEKELDAQFVGEYLC